MEIRALALHSSGDADAADRALGELQTLAEAEDPIRIAQVYAWRNDLDSAFDWLDRSLEINPGFNHYDLSRPYLAALRDDPRWDDHLARARASAAR